MTVDARAPNFFILGAAKAGTTTLHSYLALHPDIYMTAVKEPQYFSHDGLYARGMDYYLDTFFAGAGAKTVRGEATPHYLYYEKAAQRIVRSLSAERMKFIVSVRDPVARAYSLYWNMVAEGRESLSFEEALAVEATRRADPQLAVGGDVSIQYVDSGLYAKQLRQFLKYFRLDQFHFVVFERLASEPKAVLDEICAFLNLPPFATLPAIENRNAAAIARSMALQRFLRGASGLKKSVGALVPGRYKRDVVEWLLKVNKKRVAYPPMSRLTAQRLRAGFAEDVMQLERMIGQPVGGWWGLRPQRATGSNV